MSPANGQILPYPRPLRNATLRFMGRKKLRPGEHKDILIGCRVDLETHERILQAAAEEDRSVASWLRQLIRRALEEAR